MDLNTLMIALETAIFWLLVILIAWMGPRAPSWAFAFLFYYLNYLILRFIFMKQGIDRMIYMNVINILVLLALFYWFYRNQ